MRMQVILDSSFARPSAPIWGGGGGGGEIKESSGTGLHETSTKTCNETMLRDKLMAFVSRISPP